jgi:hypothetical protein
MLDVLRGQSRAQSTCASRKLEKNQKGLGVVLVNIEKHRHVVWRRRLMFVLKDRRVFRLWMAALVVALGVVACATTPEDSDSWRNSQREILMSRAEARWMGLINGDFDKAYSFLSPDYRSVVNLQQYRRKMGRALEWRLARAKDISYDSPTVASVLVEVTYQVVLPGSGLVENTRVMAEKWLYKDGGWWYTDQ